MSHDEDGNPYQMAPVPLTGERERVHVNFDAWNGVSSRNNTYKVRAFDKNSPYGLMSIRQAAIQNERCDLEEIRRVYNFRHGMDFVDHDSPEKFLLRLSMANQLDLLPTDWNPEDRQRC